MQKGAKDWFYLFKDKINSFQEFEKLFKKHFWNPNIEGNLRKKFYRGKYQERRESNRVNYAIRLLNTAKGFSTKEIEPELIRTISEHF